MKKNYLWSMLTTVMVAMLSIGFVSCGDDDDDNGGGTSGGSSALVGTWYSIISEGWEYEDGELTGHWKDLSATSTRVYEVQNGRETGQYHDYSSGDEAEWEETTFTQDGKWTSTNEDGETTTGTYTVSNGKINLFMYNTFVNSVKYSISNNQLVLTSEEYDDDGQLEEREIIYYNKGAYPNK
ncbi:MAG: hypothetical protein IJ693_08220 [Bacteroidaceae bacterium]|nr:hypothetical protein [Bacteroidaceae bacterium]